MFRIAWQIRRACHSPEPHHTAEGGPQSEASRGFRGKFLSRFLSDRDGAIAAVSAVSLVVILGMGAFAIDMSYAYSERNLLQVTASAAALAAAPELPDLSEATEKAVEYAEDNMPPAIHGMVLDSSRRGAWQLGPGHRDLDTRRGALQCR